MNILGKAAAGVAASALITGGAVGMNILARDAAFEAAADCGERFEEGEALEACRQEAFMAYDDGGLLDLLGMVGVVGMAASGYLAYQGLKAEMRTQNEPTSV